MTIAQDYYGGLRRALDAGPPGELDNVADLVLRASLCDHVVYTFGNGASAALASHMATDLGKGTAHDHGLAPSLATGRRLRVVSLADNCALMTAYGNDVGYEYLFVEQLRGLLRNGDVVVGISGSGSSPNILRALEYAKSQGAAVVGFTGSMPGSEQMAVRCDVVVRAPLARIDQIEDMHVCFNHILTRILDERLHDVGSAIRPAGHA
jgi:D-sedoheptulose 7-phosphate isomerase